ncbi:hypothetical protein LACWKB10_0228 [Lactobacillus sp. wkB10]|nr:hypothetical protein LACWKB10_0228 [Lactobacillus sp. wkB10]
MSKARSIMTMGEPAKYNKNRLINAKMQPIMMATMHLESQYMILKGLLAINSKSIFKSASLITAEQNVSRASTAASITIELIATSQLN